MASLSDRPAIPPVANTSLDFEPDQRWKTDLRQRIEVGLSSMVERAKKDYSAKRNDPSLDKSTVDDDYHKVMHDIRRIAEEQYQLALERERQERRWASGQFIDQEWSEVMIKEQQAILDNIKREGPSLPSRNSPPDGAVRNEQPAGVPTRAVAQRDTMPATEQIVRERARKPSSGFPDSTEDLRPPRSSAEDRESFPSSGTLPRRRNDERIRDRSGSIESPSQVKQEIWVPAGGSKEGGTSRTLLHAAGSFSTKQRRDSSASIGTVNSIPATIPEHSRSPDPDFANDRERMAVQENEQASGIARSRQKARKGSIGTDDRVSFNQYIGEARRGDEYGITSSPVSPFDGSRHATPITPNRPSMGTRRSFTDDARQAQSPRPWFPPPRVSEPKPIKNKRSFRDDDAGYAFRPSPSSGGWETRGSPIDENRIYASVSSSPQDDHPRSWKPPSLKSRSSLSSLRYKNATMVSPPTETYPEDTESESDSDNELEWRQRLEDEFSRRESDTKKIEAEVLRKRDEARKRELELKQKEEEARLREKEFKLRDEEARKKEEEARRKEEELKRKEAEFLQKEEEAKRKEEKVRLKEQEMRRKEKEWSEKEAEAKKREEEAEQETKRKEAEMKRTAEEAKRKEQEYEQKEREAKRKEEEARKREIEVRKKEEETRQKEEEIRQKEEEARQKEEEIRQKEEEMRRKEEETKQKEEEARQKEQEAKRKEEQTRRREREIKNKEEQLRKREKDLRVREAEARSKDDRGREAEEEVQRTRQSSVSGEAIIALLSTMKEEEIKRKEEELEKREAELERREAEVKLKEEEEAKKRELEAELKLKEEEEEAAKQRELEAEAKLKEEEEEARKRELEQQEAAREAERLKAEQLEADRLEALRLANQWQQEDIMEEQEAKVRLVEERRAAAEAKFKEEQRKEEMARRREAERREAEVKFREGQRRADDVRRQQGEYRRRDEDTRRRTDEGTRSSEMPFPPAGFSPGHMATDSASSRSSTTSHRSSTSWTASPTRPTSTASSQTPTRPVTTSTSSGRSKATSRQSGGMPAAGSSAASTSPFQSSPISEAEWARRQAEHAKKQQEQFRKEQERLERERHAKTSKVLSVDEMIQLFHDHDRQWARIQSLDELGWDGFPWPVFKRPFEPEELTSPAISAYVLSPHHPTDKSKAPKDRVKDHIKKWHPDRFETKFLTKVREEEKEKVREGAGLVARNLNELLTRSNFQEAFS